MFCGNHLKMFACRINTMYNICGYITRLTFPNNNGLILCFPKGICTGPKREFFACFCKDVIDPKRGLFIVTDDAQYR